VQLAPFPEPRHAETGSLAQLRVPYRHSDEWGVARREFGELEPSEFTDHMSLRATDVDAIREVLGELVFQRQHGCCATQLQDVDGFLFFRERDHRQSGRNLANRQGDVRIDRVFTVRDHHSGVRRCRAFVGHPVVTLAREHRDPFTEQLTGAPGSRSRPTYGVWLAMRRSITPAGDHIVLREDHVTTHVSRYFSRRQQSHPGFEPRGVEQPDEEEWQHHQQEHDPRQQHHDAEEAADVACKCDVADPQGCHDHEGPVQACDPRMLLVFHLQLDDVEQDGVESDQNGEEGEVGRERAKIGPRLPIGRQIGELTRKVFHRR
jgi:hypothetical protein